MNITHLDWDKTALPPASSARIRMDPRAPPAQLEFQVFSIISLHLCQFHIKIGRSGKGASGSVSAVQTPTLPLGHHSQLYPCSLPEAIRSNFILLSLLVA